MDRKEQKVYKTAIFTAIDVIMVFIFTWMEKLSHGVQSFWYTFYITAVFAIYYYFFEIEWHNIKKLIFTQSSP